MILRTTRLRRCARRGDPGHHAGRRAAGHRHAGFAERHHDHQREATPAARPEVRRRDQERRAAVEALVGAARRAAQGRAERAADHHRRRRLRRAQHLRRRHPDADDGPHRERGPALQPHVLHRAVLADARRADHRAQPPLGRLRRDLRAVDRLPRLQQHHRQGQGDDRPHPAGQRLRDVVVRQGPQHAGLRGQPGRAVRPVADRAWASSTSTASSAATPTSGSRTCSATRRRSIRSRASRAGTSSPGWPTTPSTT